MQFKHVFIEHFGKPTNEKLAIIIANRQQIVDWQRVRILFMHKFYNLYNKTLNNNDDILKLADDFFELLVIFLNWRIELNANFFDIFDIPSGFVDNIPFMFTLLESNLRNNHYESLANKLVYILEMLAIRSKNVQL